MSDNYIGRAPGASADDALSALTARVAILEAQRPTFSAIVSAAGAPNLDITGVPTWAKVIHLMINGVSWVAGDDAVIQLGDAGGAENAGYNGNSSYNQNGVAATLSANPVGLYLAVASDTRLAYGHCIFTLMDEATNTWAMQAMLGTLSISPYVSYGSRIKSLSQPLDRVRLTGSGASNIDLGSIRALYIG